MTPAFLTSLCVPFHVCFFFMHSLYPFHPLKGRVCRGVFWQIGQYFRLERLPQWQRLKKSQTQTSVSRNNSSRVTRVSEPYRSGSRLFSFSFFIFCKSLAVSLWCIRWHLSLGNCPKCKMHIYSIALACFCGCVWYEIKESAPYFLAWLWAFQEQVQLRLMGEEVCKEVEGRNNERGRER